MARLLSHPAQGLAKQLLAATKCALECAQQPLVAANALRALPFQQCWMHSPAYSLGASSAHSYHGSRDDEDNKNNSPASASADIVTTSEEPSSNNVSSSSKMTEQLKALQAAIEQASEAVQAGQQAREAAQLPEHVARHAMRDPLGILMTARGVPLGISLKVNPDTLFKQQRQQQSNRESEADKRDWQELLGHNTPSSSSQGSQGNEDYHTSVPSTDAQMLRVKLIKAAKKLVAAGKAARRKTDSAHSSSSSSVAETSSSSSSKGQAAADPAAAAVAAPAATSVGQQAKDQLAHLLASADTDSWGTTQQSPAEIAQQIADSNRAAAGGGGDGGGDGEEGEDDDEPLSLSATEERYADEAAVTAELKEMDEIYEVLAKVPWLDDGDVDERELRGVVAVGLLGTLEEVGWQLREKLCCLWAGERDLDVLTAGVGPREAAALTAILYHTEQLEREFDKPPADGVAAALAAAGGAGAGPVDGAAGAAAAVSGGVEAAAGEDSKKY